MTAEGELRPHVALLLITPSLAGCARLLDGLFPPEAACEDRSPYWPDADGDGVGDYGTIYIGCEAPDGYVDVPPDPPPEDSDVPADTDGDTDDTDPPSDTDTGRPDRARP